MNNDIDRKVQSVRKVESAEEIKRYEGRHSLFKNYMKEIAKKADKPLLKVANFYIPFSLGTLVTAAGCSFLGYNNEEISLGEAMHIIGKTAEADVAGALGLVVATIGAISVKEAISFTHAYMTYPKNKEELIRLGIYNKTQDALKTLEEKNTLNKEDSFKGVTK